MSDRNSYHANLTNQNSLGHQSTHSSQTTLTVGSHNNFDSTSQSGISNISSHRANRNHVKNTLRASKNVLQQSQYSHRALESYDRPNYIKPSYQKTIDDYRSIIIGIKALGKTEPSLLIQVKNKLSKSCSTLNHTIQGTDRKIYVKYEIVEDLGSSEPPFFSILQAQRKICGIILISQASNPLNVSIMQSDYDNIQEEVSNFPNIIAINWLVFSTFDESLNTVSSAIIVPQLHENLHGFASSDDETNMIYNLQEEDNHRSSYDQDLGDGILDKNSLRKKEDLVVNTAIEVIYQVAYSLEETRLSPEGTFDVLLDTSFGPESINSNISTSSNASKKQLAGRHRKYIGDLCLLTGMTRDALLSYHTAVDALRSAGDNLWLAATLESVCVASTIQIEEDSDHAVTSVDIIYEKLCESIKLYSRYKQAGILEIEASCVAARLIYKLGKKLEATSFAHNAVYVSLPIKSQMEKVYRFRAISELFKEIKMFRKASFFRRISAMQSINISDNQWPLCLRSLEESLTGFGVPHHIKNFLKSTRIEYFQENLSWVDVQARVLNETAYAARKCKIPRKGLQYLLAALENTFCNLPLGKQRDLANAIEQLAASINNKTEKSIESEDLSFADIDLKIPELTGCYLSEQPNFLNVLDNQISKSSISAGRNKSSTVTASNPFLYNPYAAKNYDFSSSKSGFSANSNFHDMKKSFSCRKGLFKFIQNSWLISNRTARANKSISLNDSFSLGFIFSNPLKIPIALTKFTYIANIEYRDGQQKRGKLETTDVRILENENFEDKSQTNSKNSDQVINQNFKNKNTLHNNIKAQNINNPDNLSEFSSVADNYKVSNSDLPNDSSENDILTATGTTSRSKVTLSSQNENIFLPAKSINKTCIISLTPVLHENSHLHNVKCIRIVGYKYKILGVNIMKLFKGNNSNFYCSCDDDYDDSDIENGTSENKESAISLQRSQSQRLKDARYHSGTTGNQCKFCKKSKKYNSIVIPVIDSVVPLLEPSKTENIVNQLNFKYKPDIGGFRSRLSVYPGESLISNITVENKHPSSAYITHLKIYNNNQGQNYSKSGNTPTRHHYNSGASGDKNNNNKNNSEKEQQFSLIQIIPKIDPNTKNFCVNYEQTKSIPMNVSVSSIEYLLKIIDEQKKQNDKEKNVTRSQNQTSKRPEKSSNDDLQTNIIEESTFVLETTYCGALEECKNYRRILDLKIMVQIRKGLEPLSLIISEFDEEYFKLTFTLQNHSKSNEFCITFNEHQDIDIFPNSEHCVSSLLPKLDRLNFSNPLEQLIQFLAARLNFSWIIYDRDSKQRSQNDRYGSWEFNEMLVTKLLQFSKPDGLSTYQYILSAVYRAPIIIHDLVISNPKKSYYQVELKWLNEQPAPPLNPTTSRLTTKSGETNTAFSGTVDIKQNYKRQWYVDLEIFQEAQILESQMLFEQHRFDQQKIQQAEIPMNFDGRRTSLEAGTEAVDLSSMANKGDKKMDDDQHSICSSEIAQISKDFHSSLNEPKLSARTRSILSSFGPRISFTNNAIFYGSANPRGRIEGNDYGEISTKFEFILGIDPSHFCKHAIFKVQAKIYIESDNDIKMKENSYQSKVKHMHSRDIEEDDIFNNIIMAPQGTRLDQGFTSAKSHQANANNGLTTYGEMDHEANKKTTSPKNTLNYKPETQFQALNIENYTNRIESEITAKGGSLLFRGGISNLTGVNGGLSQLGYVCHEPISYGKDCLHLNEKLFSDYQKEDEYYLSDTVPLVII